MRFYILTLGCPKNIVDSEGIHSELRGRGLVPVSRPEQADVLIVNTCGFIAAARDESLQALRDLARHKRANQRLIAAGCMAELHGEEIRQKVPKIDALVGTRHLDEIVAIAGHGAREAGACQASVSETIRRHTAYLKIADGCSASCAFCVIPQIKGPHYSRPAEQLREEASALARQGVKEVVLVAQDTTAYGYDQGERDALPDLLVELADAAPEVAWWRLMYAYPGHVSDRLIRVMAEHPRICHYLDLPLQHAYPDVLRRMRRPGNVQATRDLIAELRRAMPDIVLRTTFIVGYPGETEAEFQALLDFMREIEFDRAGVFAYSREEGTPAAVLEGQVPAKVKKARVERAMLAQQEISLRRHQSLVGQVLTTLIEGEGHALSPIGHRRRRSRQPSERLLVGRSYRDAPEIDGLILCRGGGRLGDLVPVKITEALAYDLAGEVVEESVSATLQTGAEAR